MTNYEKLVRKPSFFRTFTGLSAGEFDKRLADLESVWLARKAKQSASRPRRRKAGAGREAKLRLADRLLLTLLYYRAYVTQEFVGFLFGVGKGTVSRKERQTPSSFGFRASSYPGHWWVVGRWSFLQFPPC